MDIDIEEVYKMAKKGTIAKEHLEEIFTNGFNDYNNDFSYEIQNILKYILKSDTNVINESNVKEMTLLLDSNHVPHLYKDLFDNIIRNNTLVSPENFDLIIVKTSNVYDFKEKFLNEFKKSKEKFLNYTLMQKDFKLDELSMLKIFTMYPDIAKKIIEQNDLTLAKPIYEYLNETYQYKDIVKDKKINIVDFEQPIITHLSKELALTSNYMQDFLKKDVKYDPVYLNNFFKKTYSIIFDKTNTNIDKFNLSFVEKQVNIAVDSAAYEAKIAEENIKLKAQSVEEIITNMRNKYPSNHPFARFKK